MFRLDDRTGNVLTTVSLFAVTAVVVYAARATVVVFVLSLLLAYLLEPAVTWAQRLFAPGSSGRARAIGLVYVAGTSFVSVVGYLLEPALASQLRRLAGAVPELLARSSGRQFLAQHGTQVSSGVERLFQAAGAAAQNVGWLLLTPIIAIFFLTNRSALIDRTVDLFAGRRERSTVRQTVEQIDTLLAQYTRAQLLLAGLSSLFYSASMLLLGFPYPLALGLVGGALEFLPAVGWVLAAALILISGWLVHAHWIWMAGLLILWRVLQNFVISPRVMGQRLEMDPMTVLFAMMVGGQIGGLLGILLSVPVVAVLRIVWLERSSREKAAA
jgi:predicted PurR-regulated permease PerM